MYGEDGTHPIHIIENLTVPNFPHAEDGAPDTEKKESTKMSTSISRKRDDEVFIWVEEAVPLNVASLHTESTIKDSLAIFRPNMPHEHARNDHWVYS